MIIKKLTFKSSDFPEILKDIPSAPKTLYKSGSTIKELLNRPRVAIIGSRQMTSDGERVTREVSAALAEQGFLIISGLAYGVDETAHKSALEVNGLCLAVLPSPINNIIPANNNYLAELIIKKGGALISEYGPNDIPFKQNFIARNRLMSGLAQAVVITQASEKSGSLHTANFALKQGREVLVVPGNIYDPSYFGSNSLIKSFRAGVLTDYRDVLNTLNIKHHQTKAKNIIGRNNNEQLLLDLMLNGVMAGDSLLEQSRLQVTDYNQALTMLEISGKIRPLGANNWTIS